MNIIAQKFKKINFENSYKISKNTLVWFTDGACIKNGKLNATAGYASICTNGVKNGDFIIGKVDDINIKPTNIRAEGLAISNTLKYLYSDINNNSWNDIIIYTDSEFWINMIYKFMPSWSQLKFETKSNPDLTKQIYKTFIDIQKQKSIRLIHVYSHNKDFSKNSIDPFKKYCHDNNDIADQLANYAKTLLHYNTIINNFNTFN